MLKSINTLKNDHQKPFIENVEIGGNDHDYSLSIEEWVQTKWCKKTRKYRKLIDILTDVEFLKTCYERIRSKPGNMSPGGDTKQETLDGIAENWFHKATQQLKAGTYNFKASRRVLIDKSSAEGKRPLTVGSPRDKIIQEGMRAILSTIYEPQFSNNSYGFRPGKSCHMALKEVKGWKDCSWFIEIDIEKCFDTVNRKRLINILKKQIEDQRFFDILNAMFNIEIVNVQIGGPTRKQGVPQGNVLSPLLCNIYLNELDQFILKEQEQYSLGKERQRCPEYRKITRVRDSNIPWHVRREKLKKAHRLGLSYTNLRDPLYRRVKYARYADDFLIGIAGPKSLAKEIFEKVAFFLSQDLQFQISKQKSRLISSTDRQVCFLGINIIQIPKIHLPHIVEGGKSLEYKARILKRTRHAATVREQKELKKFKSEFKTILAKATSEQKKKAIPGHHSDAAKNLAMLCIENQTTAFSDSTLLTIMNRNKEIFSPNLKSAYENFLDELNRETNLILNKKHTMKSTGIHPDTGNRISIKKVDLPLQLYAPVKKIQERLKHRGMIGPKGRPIAVLAIQNESDEKIVRWFASIARGILNYYQCTDNFFRVKGLVNYFIRWSIFHTLAKKHKRTLKQTIQKVGLDFEKLNNTSFPTKLQIAMMPKRFAMNNLEEALEPLNKLWLKRTLTIDNKKCTVQGCENTSIEMHHVRKLHTLVDKVSNQVSVLSRSGKRVSGIKAYMIAKNRKQIALCSVHHDMFHKNPNFFRFSNNQIWEKPPQT